jgi:hypothetical protein
MAETNLGAVTNAIQTFWSPIFMDALAQTNILFNLCNRDYEGQISEGGGDTVKVNAINTPVGERLTIDGVGGARTFTPETMGTKSVSVKADQRLVTSFDFEDLISIQSIIDPVGNRSIEVRTAMMQAISNQLNAYLYSLVAPTPVTGFTYSTANMSAATVAEQREKAATLHWTYNKPWYALLSPAYYTDLLLDSTFGNADFGAQDAPVVGGQFGLRRFGWNLFEDNTGAGLANTPDTNGLFFHPDFLYLVSQMGPRFKISDKHAQGEFAYVMSVDWIVGAKLGIDGAAKHLVVTTEAPI